MHALAHHGYATKYIGFFFNVKYGVMLKFPRICCQKFVM